MTPAHALLGKVLEHFHQEIYPCGVEGRNDVFPWLRLERWEFRFPVGQLCDGRPSHVVRRSEDLEYFLQLVAVGASREQRPAVHHFSEDATDAPNVDRSRILARAHQDVWRAVPQRNHLMRVATDRDSEGAGEAEVGEFQGALPVDEKVLWFEVPVEDAVLMAIRYAPQKLVEERLCCGWIESSVAHVKQLFQVLVQKFEHQRELPLRVYHVAQPHDVGVLQLLQQRNFADRSARNSLVLGLQPDGLQCINLAASILRLIHDPVGALANLFQCLVLLHTPPKRGSLQPQPGPLLACTKNS
mmetsp:Transcript_55742/g.155373  ORF Transcript_55742/g.155373 Transcript_55742/m.155373 type:complete len:300 (+) Transcript_55742:189-1088(+)